MLLALTTIIGNNNINRFYESSDQLLSNKPYTNESTAWAQRGTGQVNFSQDSIEIHNNELENTTVSQHISITTNGHYRLSLQGETIEVSKGTGFADLATVVLIHRDQFGTYLKNTAAIRLHGTNGLKHFSFNTYLPKNVSNVEVSVRLLRSTGTLKVSDLKFTKTTETESYKSFFLFIVISVAFVALFLTTILAMLMDLRSLIFLGLVVGIIGVGTLLPSNQVSEISNLLAESLPEIIMQIASPLLSTFYELGSLDSSGAEVSKLGHVTSFFLLGILAASIRSHCGILFVTALIVTLALLTESLQILLLERSASTIDFYIDITFGLAGLSIAILSNQMCLLYKSKINRP